MENKISKEKINDLLKEAAKDSVQKFVEGAVINFSEKRVLLVRRNSDDFMGGLVELPSGNVDAGEGIIEALIREVKEETNLDITSVEEYLGNFDYTSGSGKNARQLNFLVFTDDTENDIKLHANEHDAYHLINLDVDTKSYMELNISDQTRSIVEKTKWDDL